MSDIFIGQLDIVETIEEPSFLDEIIKTIADLLGIEEKDAALILYGGIGLLGITFILGIIK